MLNETCKFNSEEIEKLSIASTLRSWLLQDLEASDIPLARVEGATLTVRLQAGFEKRTKLLNYNHGFLLEGAVVADGREYKTSLEDKNGHQRIIET